MRVFIVACIVFALGEARPNLNVPVAGFGTLGVDNFIIGGSNADPGEWPWQLSQQRRSSTGSWSHSCGASLLSANRALSAAHCVDGATVAVIRVIAGLHNRDDTTGTQTADASRLVMHERYQVDSATYSNDIAIIHLASAISTNGGTIQLLTLPPNNNDNFAGDTCTITGWGRTGSSNVLPNTLQEAQIQVITTAQCTANMVGVSGVQIWDNHICLFDSANNIGSCNGDSGGPLNCPYSGGFYVAGVTSWGISNALGNCLQTYPSVYTRTSAYLAWIGSN